MISIPDCKFCGETLTPKYFHNQKYYVCTKHNPSKVGYRPALLINNKILNERWYVTYNDYKLVYFNGKTILNKINRDKNDSPKDYYSRITVFDYELNILPENFANKLPILLTFS